METNSVVTAVALTATLGVDPAVSLQKLISLIRHNN